MKGDQDRAIIGQISLALDFQSITNDCIFRKRLDREKTRNKISRDEKWSEIGMLEIKYVFNNRVNNAIYPRT